MSRHHGARLGSSQPFGSRLRAARAARGPLCVGLDPHPALLAAWGLHDDVAGLEVFARTITDALADRVSLLKPQMAFFERHGSRGIAVLEQVVVEARASGALVLIDAKRGDISSTMQAYAQAYLDPRSSLAADAMTVSPYLGVEALRPAFDLARQHHAGVFILARTSNPEAAAIQSATCSDGMSVADCVVAAARAENVHAAPWGSIGVVVGATVSTPPHGLDTGGPVLAPGIGAQGATLADLPTVFGSSLPRVFPVVARAILQVGPEVRALRDTVDRLGEQCRAICG